MKIIMKFWWVIVLILIMVFIGAFSIYIFFEYSVSSKPFSYGDWASLGSFVGGIMTPLSLMFAGASVFVSYQAKKHQFNHLNNEAIKSDLKSSIIRIDSDIEQILSKDKVAFNFNNENLFYTLSEAAYNPLPNFSDAIVHCDFLEADDNIKMDVEYFKSLINISIFSRVVMNIQKLQELCLEYDKLAGNNIESKYYAKKYKIAVDRLGEKGYNLKKWDVE